MNQLTVDLSSVWSHDNWYLEWNDPKEGVLEIPLTNDEVRWISQGLRKAQRLNRLLRDNDLGIEHGDMNIWVALPERVREKLSQAGLPDTDSLVLTTTGLLARVAEGIIAKEWRDTSISGLASLQGERDMSRREREAFEEMAHAHLPEDHIKPRDVRIFLAMLWEHAHPDDRPFMGLPGEQRIGWSMRWLTKLVKAGRISRALAFRTLEDIS